MIEERIIRKVDESVLMLRQRILRVSEQRRYQLQEEHGGRLAGRDGRLDGTCLREVRRYPGHPSLALLLSRVVGADCGALAAAAGGAVLADIAR